jgi:hypothetical protein
MSKVRPQTLTRINTRLEKFLAQQLGFENVDFYEQEACIEDNKQNLFLKKFAYKILIVCNDRVYLTDNPPKKLDNFISFDDIHEIGTVDDIPKFLSGAELENSFHVTIKYNENAKRKKDLLELKRKIIELKKTIVYTNTIDSKLIDIELNTTPRTPRTFSSLDFYNDGLYENFILNDIPSDTNYNQNTFLLTNRSTNTMNTNRTNKSVRFDDESRNTRENLDQMNLQMTGDKNLDKKIETDYLLDKAVSNRYKNLIDFLKSSNRSVNNMKTSDDGLFSLSLPLTPRSLNGMPIDESTVDALSKIKSEYSLLGKETIISKKESKSLEQINDKINMNFLYEYVFFKINSIVKKLLNYNLKDNGPNFVNSCEKLH